MNIRESFLSLIRKKYGGLLFIFLTSAVITGLFSAVFMRGFEFFLSNHIQIQKTWWAFLIVPSVFLLAYLMVEKLAPFAAGTGIPQVLFATENLNEKNETVLRPLVSKRTLFIKIIVLLMAIGVGASTGREGPTVHIAACVFFIVVTFFRKWFHFKVDMRSALIAGAASGLASAFNTPLAGVTFAIEELSSNFFESIKDFVIMSIIVAAIVTQIFTEEYTYFGRLSYKATAPLLMILLVSIVCGLLGAFFSTAIVKGQKWIMTRFSGSYKRYLIPVTFGFILVGVSLAFGDEVMGPGNDTAQFLLESEWKNWVSYFPFVKILTTLLTYWSGIAGGIFAPCLSIGASVGATLGYWGQASISVCALLGMAAFLSATIQAPMTSFVIVFEMTGSHKMLLPVMLVSLISFLVAKGVGAQPLYKSLSANYAGLIKKTS